jgi:hypothetical protein
VQGVTASQADESAIGRSGSAVVPVCRFQVKSSEMPAQAPECGSWGGPVIVPRVGRQAIVWRVAAQRDAATIFHQGVTTIPFPPAPQLPHDGGRCMTQSVRALKLNRSPPPSVVATHDDASGVGQKGPIVQSLDNMKDTFTVRLLPHTSMDFPLCPSSRKWQQPLPPPPPLPSPRTTLHHRPHLPQQPKQQRSFQIASHFQTFVCATHRRR